MNFMQFALLLHQFARMSKKQLLSPYYHEALDGINAESLKLLEQDWHNEFTSLFTFFMKFIL